MLTMTSDPIALSEETLLRALTSHQRRPNLLVTCHDIPVDDVVQRLLDFCAPPFHFCSLPGNFALPSVRGGTLFLADASLLTVREQMELFDWMAIRRETQIVSVTELALSRLVESGQFLDGLFFRLNVVSLDARLRKTAGTPYRPDAFTESDRPAL